MTPVLKTIFETGSVRDADGKSYSLKSAIDREEVAFIMEVARRAPKLDETMEVGCAYGIASLALCEVLRERSACPRHTIIDPFQHRDWNGIGVANLDRADFGFYSLIEEGSEFALPRLARERPGSFDFILIDGWHTFDHTLLDLLYATRLLRTGGVVVVDDAVMQPVAKALACVLTFPCYELFGMVHPKNMTMKRRFARLAAALLPDPLARYCLPFKLWNALYPRVRFSSMVALQKIGDDGRHWNWYADF